ncbi:hypothetical protein [Sphingosinicella sp. BN140058]|uniref:hypothetical protein n=1 Tax=Sphingosinicella sp. BN140058 TaxID=1892855 RepID=UPI00101093C8|nr:hypothetical protein [Sphingosinicella sp. BN140058]QAY75818.1 hypothetical protein ETR14_04180 [Sphingosinicella sp. BN140058]
MTTSIRGDEERQAIVCSLLKSRALRWRGSLPSRHHLLRAGHIKTSLLASLILLLVPACSKAAPPEMVTSLDLKFEWGAKNHSVRATIACEARSSPAGDRTYYVPKHPVVARFGTGAVIIDNEGGGSSGLCQERAYGSRELGLDYMGPELHIIDDLRTSSRYEVVQLAARGAHFVTRQGITLLKYEVRKRDGADPRRGEGRSQSLLNKIFANAPGTNTATMFTPLVFSPFFLQERGPISGTDEHPLRRRLLALRADQVLGACELFAYSDLRALLSKYVPPDCAHRKTEFVPKPVASPTLDPSPMALGQDGVWTTGGANWDQSYARVGGRWCDVQTASATDDELWKRCVTKVRLLIDSGNEEVPIKAPMGFWDFESQKFWVFVPIVHRKYLNLTALWGTE